MKSIKMMLLPCLLFILGLQFSFGQSTEVQQLTLNVEKLSQLKNILRDMKKGYTIVSTGYNSVKNIAQGNFSLHDLFLNGLWLVSPEVRKYYKITEIIRYQKDIVLEYKSAFKRFAAGGTFNVSELNYLSKVYSKLFDESLDNLDQLAMVITANKLRMSDDERMQAIDKIFANTEDKLIFLRDFNRKTSILHVQRQHEKAEINGLGNYFKPN